MVEYVETRLDCYIEQKFGNFLDATSVQAELGVGCPSGRWFGGWQPPGLEFVVSQRVPPMVGWLAGRVGDVVGAGGGLPVLVHLWVGARTHSPQEGFIRNEAIVILGFAALLDQDVDLLPL